MFGISKHGFKRKTYDDILQELFQRSRSTFGEDVNLSSRSILGMFLRIISWTLAGIWQLAEKVYLSGYVRYAEGIQLDRLAGNIGLTRMGKTNARGYIEIYVNHTPLELDAGFIVESVTNQRYITVRNEVIRESGQRVEVVSMSKGYKSNAEIGEIVEIITPVAEVDRVGNNKEITGGQDEENDDDFRNRYYKSLSMVGSSTRSSIEATLRQTDGVQDALVNENDTNATINGIPRQHIECIVYGGTEMDIGKAILETKAGGIGTVGDIVVELDGHKVRYKKATVKNVNVEITLKVDTNYSKSYESIINDRVTEFINSRNIGETLYTSQLIMQLINIEGITNVTVKINGSTNDLIPNKTEIIRLKDLVIKYD